MEVILSANYIINKISLKKLDKTLYELWNGQRTYKYMKVWVCLVKVMVLTLEKVKI